MGGAKVKYVLNKNSFAQWISIKYFPYASYNQRDNKVHNWVGPSCNQYTFYKIKYY